jgi:uncharacterized protein YraI
LVYHALVLAHVADAVVAADTQFVLTAWNRAAEAMYEWTAVRAGRILSMSAGRLPGVGVLLVAVVIWINFFSPSSFAQSGLTIDAVVLRNANLRAGPGTTYAILGLAKAGAFVTVTGYEGEWYQLSTGEWIVKFLVKATPESRVVAFRLEDAPAKANRAANLRSGPGTHYQIVGGVQAGQRLKVIGQNQAGDWLKLLDGQWIAAFLVHRVATALPVVDEGPPRQPMSTSALTPSAGSEAESSASTKR